MATPTTTRQWILREKPVALPTFEGEDPTFELKTADLPQLQKDQVLVKTVYLSNDPAQRGFISATANPRRSYAPPVRNGDPMRAYGIAEVIQSTAESHPVGTLCTAPTNWTEFSVHDAKVCRIVEVPEGLSPTHIIGAFGMTGLTAYYGLIEVVKATKEDTVVVSGAAGATGNMVVQIAKKIIGCKRVIGMAGSDEKCRWVEELGADICLNYKAPTFKADLERETDDFVEVYFDNVGGDILDTMFTRMKVHGRIAVCGAISNYNTKSDERAGLKNFNETISNRLHVHGLLVMDYLHKALEVRAELLQAWKDGKIKVDDSTETVIDTKFVDIPRTWLKLFDGSNTGKLTTHVVE